MSNKRIREEKEEEEEDEDLKRAIQLSIQQQVPKRSKVVVDVDNDEINNNKINNNKINNNKNNTKNNNKYHGDDDDDEELKRAIAESLAFSQATNELNNNENKEKSKDSQSQFKLNFIEGLQVNANNNSVKLSDILEKKDMVGAFISSYAIDIDWFLEVFPRHVPLTLVKHYDSKIDKAGHFVLSDYITVLHPPLLPFGNMHAKLMLLLYPKHIRVVVSSSNLTKEDWYQVGQVVWYQDFPKLQKSTGDTNCEFGRNLRHFMECIQAKPHFLKEYDFRLATVKLVLSVPGYHNKENLNRYGHMQLRDIIREQTKNKNDNNDNGTQTTTSTSEKSSGKKSEKRNPERLAYYQTSSLGSTDVTWVNEFVESAYGITPSNSKKKQSSNSNNNSNLQIIFPSSKSVYGKNGRLKPGAKWSNSYSAKENVIMHSKVLLCTNVLPDFNYVYIGSHNFTQAAWGRLQKEGSQIHINNYELGVISTELQDIRMVPFKYPPVPFSPSETPWLM